MRVSGVSIRTVIAALAAFCFGLPAFAQNSVTLTGVNGSYSPGSLCSAASGCEQVYTGQYYATVNGNANSPIICDDFNHNVSIGQTWNASAVNTSTLSSVSGLEFGAGVTNAQGSYTGYQVYAMVASLVSEVFTLNNGTASIFDGIHNVTGTDLSEAIWDITTKGGITGISANAAALVSYVEALFGSDSSSQALAYLHGLNLWILTPSPNDGPQEMWSLSVSEGGAALMYLLLGGLFCFGALYKRNRESDRALDSELRRPSTK